MPKSDGLERFQRYYTVDPVSKCWLWQRQITSHGYAGFWYGNKQSYGHRFAYETFKGIVPKRMELDHLCRRRCCVNPDHLEAVTHAVNCRRGMAPAVNSALQKAKRMCKNGHLFTAENTYKSTGRNRRIWRSCKICRQAAQERFKIRAETA